MASCLHRKGASLDDHGRPVRKGYGGDIRRICWSWSCIGPRRASTLFTSNRPVNDWGKVLGDAAAVAAMLDRLLHHGHVLKCGPRSWRIKVGEALPVEEATR
jgi:hypothetical protein